MAVTVTERPDSREATEDGSTELRYHIRGTADDTVALTNLLATAPATYDSKSRQKCSVEPVVVDSDNADNCVWLGVAPYQPDELAAARPLAVGESVFNFDTTGGTEHTTQAKKHISDTACKDRTTENHQGAIGVSGDGKTGLSVQGTDIASPVYRFSETHCIAAATVTQAYKVGLHNLTGKTNDASFRGLAANTCLFLGARGTQRGAGGDYEITFLFAASPDVADACADWPAAVKPAGAVAKGGWEYLWVRYQTGPGTDRFKTQPISVHVERVYDEGDFDDLGI